MNKLTALLLILLIIAACSTDEKNATKDETPGKNTAALNDTTPKVTGIGGIFFRSKDPSRVKEWYGKNLGLAIDLYGSVFEFRNANDPGEVNYLRWAPFEEKTDYFDPSKKDFMINYRVRNLKGLIANLKAAGVTVLGEIQDYEYGSFAYILDPEGNKIELWEPVDSVLTKMGGVTTK